MLTWRINGRSLEIEDPASGSWAHLCDAFGISSVDVDLLTGIHEVVLYVDSARSGLNTTRIMREDLQKQTIMPRLYSLGLSLLDGNDDIPLVQQILFESEQNAPIVYRHNRLGFTNCDGKEIFLLDTPIGSIDPLKAASRYSVPGLVTPKGTLEEWSQIVEQDILGCPALELALAIGALAPVAHLLRESGTITDLPVIAYIGQSTTGKSTALRVGASIWGLPIESTGLIDDLNSTENAFFESLAQNTGFPAFVDETSAQSDWNFSRTLYFLPKARSKRRCNSSGALKKVSVFSGAVVFTGEHSLLKDVDIESGLRARIVELKVDHWTRDKAHAERITERFCQCYGTAAPKLVNWLFNHQDSLSKQFRIEYDRLSAQVQSASAIESRALKICAMILVAAHVIRESLSVDLDTATLSHLLASQTAENQPSCDRTTSIYNKLLEIVAENGSKFTWPNKKSSQLITNHDTWGMIEFRKSVPGIWIGRNRFCDMLQKCGVQEFKDIARPMVERGWLEDFGNRHYFRNHKINGISVLAVCLLLPDSPDIFQRLEKLPTSASSRDLSVALRGDSFEATVFSSQSETDRRIHEAGQVQVEKLACGFSIPCAQSEAFLINAPLAKALSLKDRVFVTILADDNAMLLSQEPITKASLSMALISKRNYKLCNNSAPVRAIRESLGFTLDAGQAITFTDIEVKPSSGNPVAVICADAHDPIGAIAGKASGWTLPIQVESEQNFDE